MRVFKTAHLYIILAGLVIFFCGERLRSYNAPIADASVPAGRIEIVPSKTGEIQIPVLPQYTTQEKLVFDRETQQHFVYYVRDFEVQDTAEFLELLGYLLIFIGALLFIVGAMFLPEKLARMPKPSPNAT